MARVLCISSQVAFGPVGNTAAVPALQARGHEVLVLPTVILSNHPGHGPPAGFRTAATDLASLLDRVLSLTTPDAVMTGYFASPEQIVETAVAIRLIRSRHPSLHVLVDPVMGDGTSLYVPEAVAEALRDQLVPLADCLTPNRFELEWLTGRRAGTAADAASAAQSLNRREVLATSVPAGAAHLATLVVTPSGHLEQVTALRPQVPHGTGDFLAGLYLAERLAGQAPAAALARAMSLLDRAIHRSAGSAVLDVAGALHGGSGGV
jgi:pyridoxine kinase